MGDSRMMFWICLAICTPLFLLLIYYSIRRSRENVKYDYLSKYSNGKFYSGLFFGILSAVSFVIVLTAALSVSDGLIVKEGTITHYPVTLSDSLGTVGHISGGLFFISGSINSKLYWSWYEHSRDGSGLKAVSVKETWDTNIRVKQIPKTETPRIEQVLYKQEGHTPSWIAPFNLMNDKDATDVWTLYVPRGSVTHDFKLDAQ